MFCVTLPEFTMTRNIGGDNGKPITLFPRWTAIIKAKQTVHIHTHTADDG